MQSDPSAGASARPNRGILDPRLLLRWIYIGRLSVASAIFLASLAVSGGPDSDHPTTWIAPLAFALTGAFTVISAGYSEVSRRKLGSTFLYCQALFDLVLVTAVVDVTSRWASADNLSPTLSNFAPLYILVIAASALLLPAGGSLLIATLGNLLYVVDVSLLLKVTPGAVLWPQLFVFAVVALGSAKVSVELRRRGEASDLLRVEHEQVRIRAEEILRNIRSGVVTIDEQGRLVYANPMAEQLLGLDLEHRTGEVVLPDLAARAEALGAALEAAVTMRVRIQRVEGQIIDGDREFPVGVTTTYVEDERTGARTAIAIFQDISDNKRLEAMRLRAERLEGIAELSASLAHEIKNPLASIRSSAEQLSKFPRANADERTLTALVMRESDRLSRLLSEFLDFARVRVVQSRPVDLGEVIRAASELAGAHPDRPADVSVSYALPRTGPVMIDGDEDLLHRAVFNLTLNAVQASSAGGDVLVELFTDGSAANDTHALTLSRGDSVRDGGAVTLRVSDRGSGIADDVRGRLFDPFFTTKPNGSGLGLAVVHRAVEAHRGVVLVDSGAQGTRFTIVLPRRRIAESRTDAGVTLDDVAAGVGGSDYGR